MNQNDWLNLVHTIHANKWYGKTLILDLQKIRANAIKFNFKNSSIHKLVLKANQTFKFWSSKLINHIISFLKKCFFYNV